MQPSGASDSLYRSKVTKFRVESASALSGRILDCGGGLGAYLSYLNGRVVVLDRQGEALFRLDHPRRVIADAQALPFSADSFDSVWACAVAQYVELERFMRECFRVTRKGGQVLVLVPNADSPWDRLKRLCGLGTWWDQKGIVRHYSVADLSRYGTVYGEIQFLPLERLLRNFPRLGHTLLLKAVVN